METMSGWPHQPPVWEAAEKKQLLPHSRINIDCNLMSYSNPTTSGWVCMHYLYVGLLSPELQEEVVNMPRWAGHLFLSLAIPLSHSHSPSLSPSLSLTLSLLLSFNLLLALAALSFSLEMRNEGIYLVCICVYKSNHGVLKLSLCVVCWTKYLLHTIVAHGEQ